MLKLRKIAASLLFFVMLFCVTKNSVLFVLYELDTRVFVNLFCENKARPELQCNGKCKLAQMAKENDKKDGAQALASLQAEIFLFYQEPVAILPDGPENWDAVTLYAPFALAKYSFQFLHSNDKPPEILS